MAFALIDTCYLFRHVVCVISHWPNQHIVSIIYQGSLRGKPLDEAFPFSFNTLLSYCIVLIVNFIKQMAYILYIL